MYPSLKSVKCLTKTLEVLVSSNSYRATYYLSPAFTVKAVRRHRIDRRDSRVEIVLTFGAPNYKERLFIKACKRAGESFPVKKIQLKAFPRRKKH